MKVLSSFVIAIVLFLSSQNSFAASKEANFVVAKVNNKIITNLDLTDRYRFVMLSSKISNMSAEDKKNLLSQIVDKMIDEELIRQEAENLKITVTSDEIADAIELAALHQKKNAVQFKLSLITRGVSFENYAKQVESELLWSKIIFDVLKSRVKITDVETKEFFEQQKLNINIKKLHIAEIFIPNSISEGNSVQLLAKKLVLELRKGANFKNMVKQFSRDSLSAEHGGEIGWVSNSDIDPKIYQEISKLKKGEYSDPIFLADGYYIFKLIDSRVETKIAEQDLNAARNNIFVRKLQSLAKGYLMDLRKKSFIEISRDKLRHN
ncbi:MAG: SurA N-terminal domain-containing protein [Rickettsiales bacterium]|nr:SurA N-terminal domain-containing protein [Rickettsiales bacterium]